MKSPRIVILGIVGIFALGVLATTALAQDTTPPRQEDPQNTNPARPADPMDRNANTRSDQSGYDRDKDSMPPQSAGEVRRLLDQTKKSFPELIQAAESKSGGKAVSAAIMEWRCVSDAVKHNQTNNTVTGDVTAADISTKSPAEPVAVIACVDNNKVTEVVVCANTGKIISTAQCPQFSMGKSSFVCMKGDSMAGSGFHSRWNAAPRRWQKVSDLLKKPVTSEQTREQIGDIQDLVIDPDGGRVLFSIIEFDDKMGHGNRWFAVPLRVAKLSEDYKSVQMDYTTAEVNKANGFDSNSWPNIGDESWASQVYKAYGERPYWKSRRDDGTGRISRASATDDNRARTITAADRGDRRHRGMNYPTRWQKASDLIGKNVRNPSANEDLGTLKDIVVDPDSGRILYGVLSYGGFMGLGNKLFAIPWNSLDLAADYKAVNLSVDKERLKAAEGFDEDKWPNMADQQWAGKTYDYYGQPRYWESTDHDDLDANDLDANDRD